VGAAVLVVVVLDQLTKQLALSHLADGPVDLPWSFQLVLAFNDSAAFSMGGGRTSWIAAAGCVIAVAILVLGLRAEDRRTAIGYGVLAGGAAGNLVDRAFRDGRGFLGGRVVDFVDPGWWPVFNLADSALWVGIGLLLLAARHQDRAGRAESVASGPSSPSS
jgi:signal peptidase II